MIGEACALASAFVWAVAIVCFKLSGERVSPLALNLFKNAVAAPLLIATLAFMPFGFSSVLNAHPGDLAILVISGVLGIAIADTLVFRALNLCGVGILSIIDCTYTPFVMLSALAILDERIGLQQFCGAGLIIAAVLLASRHPPPADRTPRQIVLGVVLGASAIALMAVGITFARLTLAYNDFPLIAATVVRMVAGLIFLILIAAASPRRAQLFAVFRPAGVWRFSITGSVLGGYLSLILWMAGFKYAPAAVAAVLNQTTVFFAMALASLVLHEPFGRRKAAATALGFGGVLLATV